MSEQNAVSAAFLADAEPVADAEPKKTPETTPKEPGEPKAPENTEQPEENDEPGEQAAVEEPPTDAGPEWLEKVRQRIAETGEIPDWFFDRAAKPLIHEAEKNARIRALESEVEALKVKAETAPTVVVDTPDNAFAKLNEADLKQNLDYFTNQRAWALRHLTIGGSVGDKEYSPEETAELFLQAENALEQIKSAKEDSAQRRTHFEKVAKVAYPDLAVPFSELRRQVDAIKASKPGYARHPESDTDIADMLAGRKLREDKAKGIQTVTLQAKPKPTIPKPTVAPVAATVPKVPISHQTAQPDLDSLRKQALAGSEKAQNMIAAAFLQPAE